MGYMPLNASIYLCHHCSSNSCNYSVTFCLIKIKTLKTKLQIIIRGYNCNYGCSSSLPIHLNIYIYIYIYIYACVCVMCVVCGYTRTYIYILEILFSSIVICVCRIEKLGMARKIFFLFIVVMVLVFSKDTSPPSCRPGLDKSVLMVTTWIFTSRFH